MKLDDGPYRLVSQSDFDGVVSAALLRERGLVDGVKFVHPRDVADRLIELGERDIGAGVPYVDTVAVAFDHRLSERLRNGDSPKYVVDPTSPSTARVIYNYFGGPEAFPNIRKDLMEAVDRACAGRFSWEEVLGPTGWALLYFVIDARTGLGRWGNFRVSNQQLMLDLVEYCTELSIDEILELPDVSERVSLYRSHEMAFQEQVRRCSRLYQNVLVVDFTGEDELYAGNRFVKFALFPDANVAVQITWGFERQHLQLTVSKSIFNRTSSLNVGALLLQFDGGGYADSGTCQVPTDKAPAVLEEIVERLSAVPAETASNRFRYIRKSESADD